MHFKKINNNYELITINYPVFHKLKHQLYKKEVYYVNIKH